MTARFLLRGTANESHVWFGRCAVFRNACFLPLHSFCSRRTNNNNSTKERKHTNSMPGVAKRRRGPTVRRLRRRVYCCYCCYSPLQLIRMTILRQYGRSPRWTSGSPRMPLVLIRGFESRRGKILIFFAKIKKKDQLLRASSAGKRTIRRESTREERAEIFSR